MRSSRVVTASDSQCRSRNCPGFDPSILRHSGIWGAAEEVVLISYIKKKKIQKISLLKEKRKFFFWINQRWRPLSDSREKNEGPLAVPGGLRPLKDGWEEDSCASAAAGGRSEPPGLRQQPQAGGQGSGWRLRSAQVKNRPFRISWELPSPQSPFCL